MATKTYYCKCLKNMDLKKVYSGVVYADTNINAKKKFKKQYPSNLKYTNHQCKILK